MAKVKIHSGDYQMIIDTKGSRILSLTHSGEEVMREAKDSLQGYNGMVLAPWPNRIPDGMWSLNGTSYHLEINEADRNNALHGFAFKTEFEVLSHDDSELTLRAELHESSGYPFEISLQITYRLNDQGLNCTVMACNKSKTPAPFGIAFHPYYPVEDTTRITIPASSHIITNEQMIPIGSEANLYRNFQFGEVDFDDCFSGLERQSGLAEIKIQSRDQLVTLWQDEAFEFVMVYTTNEFEAVTGSNKAIAIEAQSCAANAFNTEPPLLQPGGVFKGTWGLTLSRS